MPPQKPPGQGMRFGKIIREAIPKKPKKAPRRKLINPRRKK